MRSSRTRMTRAGSRPAPGADDQRREQMSTEAKCPFKHTAGAGPSNRDWWPNQLNLKILHQHSPLSDPMGKGFNYATSGVGAQNLTGGNLPHTREGDQR